MSKTFPKLSIPSKIAGIALSVLIVLSISSPYFSEWGFEQMDFNAMETAPSLTHWFGTDQVGRDLYIRTMSGSKVSLFVSLLATLVSIPIGVTWGSVAGYIGGRVDELMMRFVDVLYSLPFILIVILLTVIFGPNLYLLFGALGAIYWLDMARIVRGQTLKLKNASFVLAAHQHEMSFYTTSSPTLEVP